MYTDSQIFILQVLVKVISSISLALLLTVSFLYTWLGYLGEISSQLIFSLCVIEILNYIGMVFPTSSSVDVTTICYIQSLFQSFFPLAAIINVTIISYTIYISIKIQDHVDKYKNTYRIGFILIMTLIPLAFTLVTVFSGTIGFSGAWCWLDFANKQIDYEVKSIVLFYFLIIIINSIICIGFIFAVYKILKREKADSTYINKLLRRLKWYPIVQVFSIIPYVINRMVYFFGDELSFELMVIQVVFDNMRGIVFCVIACLTTNIINEIKDRCCCKKRRKKDSMNNEQRNSCSFEMEMDVY